MFSSNHISHDDTVDDHHDHAGCPRTRTSVFACFREPARIGSPRLGVKPPTDYRLGK